MAGDTGGVLDAVESCLAAGDHVRAEEILRTALASDPHHPRLLTAYARAKLGQSDWAAAAASAHAALSGDPHNEHALRVYTRALEMQGRLDEALWTAGRTVAMHPLSHQAHYGHARLLVATGRTAEALTAVNEALRLNPADTDSLVLRGNLSVAVKQYGPAEADYRAALRLNPADAEAIHGSALLDHARGRRWSAVRGFLRVEGLDPSYREVVRQNVGEVLAGLLRRWAWLVLIVGFAVIVTYTMGEDGEPTVVPRLVAGIGAALLLVPIVRMAREVPGRMLRSVLRERQILALRIMQLIAGVVFGVATALFGAITPTAVLASVLVLSLPVVAIVGYFTGERLW